MGQAEHCRILLCCDCEGTHKQLEDMWQAIELVGVPANFFFVGDTVNDFPELIREIASNHQTESHTMHHYNLRKLSYYEQRHAILEGKDVVENCIQRPTRGFRAPFHSLNWDTVRILNENDFTFDASLLYYRYLKLGKVEMIRPTWFREWMPLYRTIGLSPQRAFDIFRALVKRTNVSVLPAHPQYSGLHHYIICAFRDFLQWAVDEGATFSSIDAFLNEKRNVEPPEWKSPLDDPEIWHGKHSLKQEPNQKLDRAITST